MAKYGSANTNEDVAVSIRLQATDPNGDALTFAITDQPDHGTLGPIGVVTCESATKSCQADLTYTPNANYNGDDSFKFQANDRKRTSTATVDITVAAVNDTPEALGDGSASTPAATTDEDVATGQIDVLSNDTGLGDKPISLTIESQGSKGTATVNSDNTITYTPNADANGSDSFVYEVCDADSTPECDTATVSITIDSVNDAPANTVPTGPLAALQDTDESISGISIADVDAGSGTVEVTLSVTDGTLTLKTDVSGGLSTGDVSGAGTKSVTATGTLAQINATLADANGLVYRSDATFSGTDTLTVTTDDQGNTGSGGPQTDTDTVSINVRPPNEPPVVDLNDDGAGINTTASFTEDGGPVALAPVGEVSDADDTEVTSAEITLTNRPDGDAESLSVDTGTTSISASSYDSSTGKLTLSGTASLANYQQVLRTVEYDNSSDTPDTTDRVVEFTVNDGQDDSEVATSTVSVAAADDPPLAVNDSATKAEDSDATAIDVLTNDTDVDGGMKSITEVTQPTNGTVVITNDGADLTYAPDADYCNDPPGTSPDTFTYTLSPGDSTATVSVKVTCVDDPPVAVNDSAAVLEDAAATSVSVLTNDTDIDSGPKTISSVSDPANGTVVLTGGSPGAHTGLTYQPDPNYCNDPPATNLDTFTYTLNGGSQATVSMTVTCVNDAPVADDETFTGTNGAIGNTTLVGNDPSDGPPSATGPKKTIIGDILAGDNDVDGPNALTVQAGTFTTNDGGSVTIEADGDFTYINDPADACADTSDFFDYTVTDGNSPTAGTDTGRVNVSISGCVWYVSNNATGNSGTSVAPFDTLAQAESASAANHTIFVFDGDNTASGYGAGIDLKANQKLIGEAANLVVGSDTLHTGDSTKRPTLTDNNADVVALDDANEVRGVEVDPSGTGGGIAGVTGDTGGGTIDDVRIIDNGTAGTQPGLELDATTGTFNVSNLVVNNKATGVRLHNTTTPTNAVNAVFVPASQISITSDGGPGLDVDGTAATPVNLGTSTFDDITVTNSGSGGVNITNATGPNNLGDGSGTDLALTTTSGSTPAFGLSNAGAVSVPSGGTANVSTTGGPAVDVTGTSGASLAFDDVDSTNSSGDGINLAGLGSGSFSADGNSSISNATGIDFDLDGGSGAITYGGTISDDVGQLVRVANTTGGTKDFNGNITDGEDGDGSGVALTSNAGATVRFDGGLTLATGANAAFAATGGGTVAVTDPNAVGTAPDNTLTTTTATALNVANTTIGSDNLTFKSIASNGGGNPGIVLNSTGSSGGLSVTGTGSANSGGTIQNKTGNGIQLTNTSNVSLSNMTISGNQGSGDFLPSPDVLGGGVVGTNVTNFSLTGSTVSNNGNQQDGTEAGLRFDNLLGTSAITNSTFSGVAEDHVLVTNSSGTLTGLTVTNSTFNAQSTPTGGHGVSWIGRGTAQGTVTVNNSTFQNVRSSGVIMNLADTSVGTLNVNGSNFTDTGVMVTLGSTDSADLNFNITNNTGLRGSSQSNAMQLVAGSTSTNASQIRGTFSGNAIGDNTIESGTGEPLPVAYGIAIDLRGDQDSALAVTGNTLQHTEWEGIWISAADFGSNAAQNPTTDLTVRDNNVLSIDDNGDGPGGDPDFPRLDIRGVLVDFRHTMNGCLDMAGNTSVGSPGFEHIRVRQRDTSVVRLERFSDGDATPNEVINNVATVESFLAAQNDPGSTADATLTTGFTEAADGVCRNP